MEVIYSTFDELPEHHKRVSEMVIATGKASRRAWPGGYDPSGQHHKAGDGLTT